MSHRISSNSEPTKLYWNNERLKQVVGRAVRYQSHSSLPAKERHVTIYTLILQTPSEFKNGMKSYDTFLTQADDERHNDKDFDWAKHKEDLASNSISADGFLWAMSKNKDEIIDRFYKLLIKISI